MSSCLSLLSDQLSIHAKESHSLCAKVNWKINKGQNAYTWIYEHLKIILCLCICTLNEKKEILTYSGQITLGERFKCLVS